MKKFVKSISLILATLMLLAAIPFVANAKTLAKTTTKHYYDNEPLLELDTLLGRGTAGKVGVVTVSETKYDNCSNGEKSDTIYASSATGWVHAGVTTSLDLTSTTKYTIEFYMNRSATHYAGFLWTVVTDTEKWNGSYGVIGNHTRNVQILSSNGESSDRVGNYGNTAKFWDEYAGSDGYTKFIVELNGYTSTVYIHDAENNNDIKIGSKTDASYATDKLGLGFVGFANAANSAVMSIKDVKVYSGLYETTEATLDCNNGDELLKVGNLLDTTTASSAYEDVTVTAKTAQNSTTGAQADAAYGVAKGWMFAGLDTTIPLTYNSKYTIDFYMQRYDNHYAGFVWTTDSWSTAQGVIGNHTENKQILSLKGTANSTNAYGNYGTTANFWSSYAEADGYTHFAIEIDGYKSTVYIAGNKVGTVDMSKDGYTSDTLGLGMVGYTNTDPYTGKTLAIKNVTVRYGNVMSEVKFVNGATELSKTNVGDGTALGSILPATPAPTTEGNLVKWFYQGTDIMVLATDKVSGDVVIEAKEIDPATYTSVAGMQYTTPDENNKQSVRFLARLYTLDATEAGFEVNAKYKDGTTVKEDKEWAVKATVVYTAINANVNGTVKAVTADDLGSTYLIALAVDEVPTNIGQVDFYVRSYITVNGEKQYSDWVTYTTNNGEYAPDLAPLTSAN